MAAPRALLIPDAARFGDLDGYEDRRPKGSLSGAAQMETTRGAGGRRVGWSV